jgi:hypothetical protein
MVDDFNSDELIKVMTEITNGGSEILNSLKKGSDKYKEYKELQKEIKEIKDAGGIVEIPGEFPI